MSELRGRGAFCLLALPPRKAAAEKIPGCEAVPAFLLVFIQVPLRVHMLGLGVGVHRVFLGVRFSWFFCAHACVNVPVVVPSFLGLCFPTAKPLRAVAESCTHPR